MFISVELVATALPEMYVERILEFVSKQVSGSHHIEFYLSWATQILTIHAQKENIFKQQSLVSIQDSLTRKYEALSKICDYNKYTLKVLREMSEANAANENQETDSDDDGDESDLDDNNLVLIRPNTNGDHDEDVEMPTDESSSDEG